MTIKATRRDACFLALMLCVSGGRAASKQDLDELMSGQGLQKTKVKGIDLAYARPGASLAAYKRVMIDPVDVQFDPSWDPVRTGSLIKLGSEEREKIRTGVARIVYDEFVKALQAKSTYQIVTEPGPDVLRVKASIVNLYVNAPDSAGASRSRTWVSSAGRMTLQSALSDAASGQLLALVVDRREAGNSGRMQLSSSVLDEGEAEAVAADWARILRKALDNAHGIGK
jgi:Protein of unknown function (DUF3313)